MSWTEPKTDWAEGDNCTAEDISRIAGNIAFLYPAYGGQTAWTQNDILTVSDWTAMTAALSALIVTSGYDGTVPGAEQTAQTYNDIEELISGLYDRIGLNLAQKVANVYPSSAVPIYPSESIENYVRGV